MSPHFADANARSVSYSPPPTHSLQDEHNNKQAENVSIHSFTKDDGHDFGILLSLLVLTQVRMKLLRETSMQHTKCVTFQA